VVVVHGGFGLADMVGDLLDRLAERRRVIAVELQGRGHTRDIDRPFRYGAGPRPACLSGDSQSSQAASSFGNYRDGSGVGDHRTIAW
jgi:pimeloyl-ACP methyl ester carboxylesterase